VTPMQRLTGERMTSSEMGQRKKLGILTSSPPCCGGSLMAVSFQTMGRLRLMLTELPNGS
jgi:hypothetical protein